MENKTMTNPLDAKDHLRSFIERIERLEEEKAALAADIREVYAEAKATGFDAPTMRAIVRERKLDAQEREAQQMLLETYRDALGDLGGTPLGDAALAAA